MWRLILRRLLQAVPVLLAISLLTFLMVRLAPGDPLWTTLDPAPQ